jgi:hypothetical protein
MFPVDRR